MTNKEIVIRKSVVSKVLEVAQACMDDKRKGWFVSMPKFWSAMDAFNFGSRDVRAALAFLALRMYVIVFLDDDGQIAGISMVPQRYRCGHCNMLLDMLDDFVDHIDICLKQQKKIERNPLLLITARNDL